MEGNQIHEVRIYVKTSIKGPARQDGRACYVIEAAGREPVSRTGPIYHVNANAAEIITLAAALKKARDRQYAGIFHIYVQTDYVAATISNNRLWKWKEVGWCNKKGQRVANMEEWQQIHEILKDHSVQVHQGENNQFTDWMEFQTQRKA